MQVTNDNKNFIFLEKKPHEFQNSMGEVKGLNFTSGEKKLTFKKTLSTLNGDDNHSLSKLKQQNNDFTRNPTLNKKDLNSKDLALKVEKKEASLPLKRKTPALNEEEDSSVSQVQDIGVYQDFFKKMENDLGVTPAQILKAFAKLTPDELQQPPENNIEKIVENLSLNPQEQEVARFFFHEMLKKSAENNMAQFLKKSHQELILEVHNANDIEIKKRSQSVDNLQQQFFLPNNRDISGSTRGKNLLEKNGFAPKVQLSEKMNSSWVNLNEPEVERSEEITDFPGSILSEESGTEKGLHSELEMVLPSEREGNSSSQSGQKEFRSTPIENRTFDPTDLGVSGLTVKGDNNGDTSEKLKQALEQLVGVSDNSFVSQLGDKEQNHLANKDVNPMMGFYPPENLKEFNPAMEKKGSFRPTTSEIANQKMDPNSTSSLLMKGNDSESEDVSSENSQRGSSSFSFKTNVPPGDSFNINNSNLVKNSFGVNPQPNPVQTASNVKEIISHAQFLAQKGGGEMKITLAPEGLGEVSMKVAVNSGQVSIQMVAESNEAKKIIEKGLVDLKSSLLSHDLKVNHIRVDTPGDISKQMTQNQDDSQRQFAQQFMQQFQQENNEWRRGFFDLPGAKIYRSQKEVAEKAEVLRPSSRGNESAQRLNLVA
ncbi:MAG: flagellar hook-length control protein FliK [Bdellovibrionales bacterium]|nr:flagellar hook-length control protein FliK [Bdellovibrionales bacterium]